MQSWWYMCLQGISLTDVPNSKGSLQTAQCDSEIKWLWSISMVGKESMAAFDAGGCSYLPIPLISI